MTAAAPATQAVAAQLAMELRLTARRGENLLALLGIPVAVLLFFGAVPVLGASTTGSVETLLPGVLALAVISASFVNLGIATAYERSYGVLKRLGGTPLTRSGLVAAKMGGVAIVEIGQVALLCMLAAIAFGWAPGPGWSPLTVGVALVLGTIAFAGLGLLLAGTLRAEGTLAVANGLYLVFMLVGGVIVPLDRLPGALATIASLLPSGALTTLLQSGLGAAAVDTTGPLLVLSAWAVGGAGLAARWFRWD